MTGLIAILTLIGCLLVLLTITTGFLIHTTYENRWIALPIGVCTVFLGTWIGQGLTFFVGRYVFSGMTTRLKKRYKFL